MLEGTVVTVDVAALGADDRAAGFYVVIGPFVDSTDATDAARALTAIIEGGAALDR